MIGFVVNPKAGNGRGLQVWREVEASLGRREALYDVRFTCQPGDGEKLARELADRGATVVVAVGGDGTVQEVAHGLIACEQPPALGCIPAGSGNDFARAHGVPADPADALTCILVDKRKASLDVLVHCGGIAVNAIGAGLDGRVAEIANRAAYKKWANRIGLSKLAYVLAAVRTMLTYRPCRVLLEVDGEQMELSDVWMVTIANTSYYGGGMKICPQAVPDDGTADVCVVSGVNRWTLLRVFPQVYAGRHAGHPAVRMYRGKRIRLTAERPLPVQADGEQAGLTPLDVQVLPSCVSICRPE